MISLCGSGHRSHKLGLTLRDTLSTLPNIIIPQLIHLRPQVIYSGMALGWDQAIAYSAILCSIPFVAAIPFDGFNSKWDSEQKRLHDQLVGYAYLVHHVCDPGYAGWKMQKRNEWMVDHTVGVLACWDGVKKSGTYNCIKYANKKKKEIINLFDNIKKA